MIQCLCGLLVVSKWFTEETSYALVCHMLFRSMQSSILAKRSIFVYERCAHHFSASSLYLLLHKATYIECSNGLENGCNVMSMEDSFTYRTDAKGIETNRRITQHKLMLFSSCFLYVWDDDGLDTDPRVLINFPCEV